MHFTLHALARSCQRSVPHHIVRAVYAYGTCRSAPGGATMVTLDRCAIALAEDDLGPSARKLAHYLGIYLVMGAAERVVTIARPCRRRHH